MKKFLILYKGPATSPDASHEGWREWFQKNGKNIVEMGSPILNGVTFHPDGKTDKNASSFNGYSIIQAENQEEACNLIKDHPYLSQDSDNYTIEICELER